MPIISRLRALRLPGKWSGNWLKLAEYLLLAVLAIQVARLLWAVVTPVGAFGEWRGRQVVVPPLAMRQALFQSFDPFYRAGPVESGPAVVTSLSLSVFGIRVNEGTGQGSAIIATPDGTQNSYAVGDEILPGVTLKEVAFDHVVIDRGGNAESVFLDQSVAAPVAEAADGAQSAMPSMTDVPVPTGPRGDVPAEAVKSDVGFAPRTEGGRITGLVLSPRGPAFENAGFRPGDIVTQINGRPIGSLADLQALQNQLTPGARISLSVERGAQVVPIALTLQGK